MARAARLPRKARASSAAIHVSIPSTRARQNLASWSGSTWAPRTALGRSGRSGRHPRRPRDAKTSTSTTQDRSEGLGHHLGVSRRALRPLRPPAPRRARARPRGSRIPQRSAGREPRAAHEPRGSGALGRVRAPREPARKASAAVSARACAARKSARRSGLGRTRGRVRLPPGPAETSTRACAWCVRARACC